MSNITGVDRGNIENVVDNSLMVLVRQPPLRQFGIGVATGWLSGYVFIQVSRLAAILGGCSALLIWVSFYNLGPLIHITLNTYLALELILFWWF